MKKPQVLMTGVTSFTGSYIARALGEAGFTVTGVLTRPRSAYAEGLARRRLEFSQVTHFWEDSPLGSENFLRQLAGESFDLFLSHGAAIQGYRSPDFDFVKSVSETLRSVKEIFALFRQQSLRGILHSGTVFEPVDGLPAVSPYGLSKQMVWDAYLYFAQTSKIPIAKIWIPNPIGPLENEDRLLPLFVKLWKEKKSAKLTVPRLVYDHVPAAWLAQAYVRSAERFLSPNAPEVTHVRPSGFVLSNQELVERLRRSFQKLSQFACDYTVSEDPNFKLGVTRKNLETCPELGQSEVVEAFWDDYARSCWTEAKV